MSVIDQKEYLKRYLSLGDEKQKNKKRRRKAKIIKDRVKIIDDDVDVEHNIEEKDIDAFLTAEDAPQIVGIVDERPLSMRLDDYRNSGKWKLVGSDDEQNEPQNANKPSDKSKISSSSTKLKNKNAPVDEQKSTKRKSRFTDASPTREDSDLSPPRKSKKPPDSDLSPPRKSTKNYDSDLSPPRRSTKNYDLDLSPPRRSTKNYDSDLSPPRKSKRPTDTDLSPPRKQKKNYDSDLSPPRRSRKNSDADLSPPRKQRKNYDSDLSPPRKSRKDQDLSPPRRSRKNSDLSPPRKQKKNYDSDLSPSRKSRKVPNSSSPRKQRKNYDSDLSPPRRFQKNSGSDLSPPRRLRKNSDSDLSPARKVRKDSGSDHSRKQWRGSSPPRNENSNKKMTKTLEGKIAGLQSGKDLKEESKVLRKREDEMFKNLSTEVSGRGAATVLRDRKTGKIRDLEKEAIENYEKQKVENVKKQKYDRWGKGLKQVEDKQEKMQQELYEMTKPLARYADDQDLEQYLKEQEREGDPMLQYIRKKKKEKAVASGEPVDAKPRYEGDFMPNRFGIPPGYRWDGVDRSNGYEKEWFKVQNSKKAVEEEIYKWSTEDM